MKRFFIFTLVALVEAVVANVSMAQVSYLDHQHMDFRLTYDANATGTNRLDILLRYNSTAQQGPDYFVATNQDVYIVGRTNARLTIPGNANFTFLGAAGAPIWILPQSQNTNLPYLGVSGEDLPDNTFTGSVSFELISVEGPIRNFFAYANTGVGQPPIIKFICTNGVVSTQYNAITPAIGSHEHYNWGFSTNGLYRVTLRCSGQRIGESTNIIGKEVAWAFQILPLRPWEQWVSTNWLPATGTNIAGRNADPDGDGMVNVLEYAFGNDPNVALVTNLPACVFVNVNGTNYGALRYCWNTNATDLSLSVVAADSLTATNWSPLTNVFSIATNNAVETIIVRDEVPVNTAKNRFFQLRVMPQFLSYP